MEMHAQIANNKVYPGILSSAEMADNSTSEEEQFFWTHYIPKEQIGSGASASVISAVRVEDNSLVAIKIMDRAKVPYTTENINDGTLFQSVPKEVLALSQVAQDVPGAIELLDWAETKDKVFLVMELPHNSMDLRQYLNMKCGAVPELIVKDMMTQLISTVLEMKERNVLHRDLKLENILVEEESGNLKLIDFGLTSKFPSLDWTSRIRMGTALCHPPEMLEQRKFIAGPGMVWALGVIGYTLLTGSPPFKEGSLKKRKAKFPKEISKECEAFFNKCFTRDPEIRLPLNKMLSHCWLKSFISASNANEY